jgi:hypothetical protein
VVLVGGLTGMRASTAGLRVRPAAASTTSRCRRTAAVASRLLLHSAEMIGPGGLAARLVTTAIAGDLGVRLHPLPGPPVPALFA